MGLKFEIETYSIIGAAMSVHKELGHGFHETVYQEALELEFQNADIPYSREVELVIAYKGRELKKRYVADFVCYDKIIVELKAVSDISDSHLAQVLNYLKATNRSVGLILNFGTSKFNHKRVVF